MRTFNDNAGRTWTVAINVNAVRRCRSLLGIDLYGLLDDGFRGLGDLLSDVVRLIDVVYVLVEDQADARDVSDEDFGRSLSGDSIDQITEAFLGALTDFFPSPRVREALTRMIAASGRMRDLMLDRAMTRLDAIDLDSEVERLIARSTASPASSASTPGPSRSGN